MDIHIQNVFRAAQQGIFSPEPLDFTHMLKEIVNNRTFKAHLPTCIHNVRKSKEEQDRDRYNNCSHHNVTHNPNLNSGWKYHYNKRYSKVFHPHHNKIPKRNGIQICGKIQSLGIYHEGCHFSHNKNNHGTPLHT